MARDRMAAAPHRDVQVVLARQRESGHDVGGAGAARDERRPPVDGGVEDAPGVVVAGVAVAEQFAAKGFDGGGVEGRFHAASNVLRVHGAA